MRISDWSSDVCSSDLGVAKQGALLREREIQSLRVEIETLQEREHELERGIAAWRDRLLAAEQQREDAQRGLYMAHRSVSELAGQLQSQQGRLESARNRIARLRSEERRGGKECGRTCRSRWSRDH